MSSIGTALPSAIKWCCPELGQHPAASSLDKVAKVNLYLADFGMIGAANEIYAQYFKHRPAKTGAGVDKLWGGALIEIEVVASR